MVPLFKDETLPELAVLLPAVRGNPFDLLLAFLIRLVATLDDRSTELLLRVMHDIGGINFGTRGRWW